MTAAYLLFAVLAGIGFYLASAHQRLLPNLRVRAATLRIAATVCTLLSTGAAVAALGVWPGVFAALTALMLVCVAMPYLDAWRNARKAPDHVG